MSYQVQLQWSLEVLCMQWHLYFTFSLSLCQWVLSKIECESYLGSNEHYLSSSETMA